MMTLFSENYHHLIWLNEDPLAATENQSFIGNWIFVAFDAQVLLYVEES
jgi:hypothetical protein